MCEDCEKESCEKHFPKEITLPLKEKSMNFMTLKEFHEWIGTQLEEHGEKELFYVDFSGEVVEHIEIHNVRNPENLVDSIYIS